MIGENLKFFFTRPQSDGGPCSACAVGKFKDAIGPATCTQCIAGKYLETTGAYTVDACVNCPSGTYSTTAGAGAESTCIKCAADTYYKIGARGGNERCVLYCRTITKLCAWGEEESLQGVSRKT